jgi:DNA-binding MarR family transcriptional regulator
MTVTTPTDVLVLHAVRTLGYADVGRIAERLDLTEPDVAEHLLDAQARGWVTTSSFAGDSGWSLTEAGKRHGERLLAAELDTAGARGPVERVYQDFLVVNETVAEACTSWQLAELGLGERPVTLEETVATLAAASRALAELEERLTGWLARFAGYYRRFDAAVLRAPADPGWVTATDRDSCHRVWFELHEDLIATLGLERA